MSQGLRWAFNVKEWKPTKAQWNMCLRCVQKEESDRCNRFCFLDDCKSSMIGRLLMRKAVNESLVIGYDKIIFARTDSGKPYLIDESENRISFNVSHHGDFCVLASEKYVPVGIDVMKIEYKNQRPLSSYFELMKKQFSTYEWNFISLPGKEKDQLERFFRLWCLKESYVKAVGTGIAYDLQKISFSIKTLNLKCNEVVTDTKLYKDDILQKDWKFEESFLDGNHCTAVAINIKEIETPNGIFFYSPKTFHVINYDELMKNSVPFGDTDENFWEDFISKSEKK